MVFFCSVTVWNQAEEKKCQLREVFNTSNQDYDMSVCGPATYVIDQTPSLTQVPAVLFLIVLCCES